MPQGPKQPPGVGGTTYREVVDKARSRQELVERLYAFTLDARPGLGPGCTRDELSEVTADMIVRLLEVSEAEPGSVEADSFAHTVAALQQVRVPEPGARVHRAPGWRARVKQRLLQELGVQRRARAGADVDPERLAAPQPESEAAPAPCLGDLPERVLAELHARLERAWADVLAEVRVALRAGSRATTWQRRAAILDVLAAQAAAETEHGVVSDTLEDLLARTAPEAVIERVQAEVAAGRIKGSVRVSPSVWRKDVAKVRAHLRERLPWMREEERELRLSCLTRWTGKVVERDLRARAEELRRQGEAR